MKDGPFRGYWVVLNCFQDVYGLLVSHAYRLQSPNHMANGRFNIPPGVSVV